VFPDKACHPSTDDGDVSIATRRPLALPAERAWLGYLCVGLIATGVFFLVPGGIAGAAVTDGIAFSAVVALAVAPRLLRLRPALPWYLFAVGLAGFTAGDVLWDVYDLTGSGGTPFPSAADVMYLAGYPLLVAGTFMLAHGFGKSHRREGLIDGAIVACGLGAVAWEPLVHGYRSQPGVSGFGHTVLVAYVVGDLLVLAAVGRLLVAAVWMPASLLLLAAAAALLVTDVVYEASAASFQPGNALELGYLLSYVFWGGAALHPSARRLGLPTAERSFGYLRFLILVAASLVVPAVLFYERLGGGGIMLGQLVFGMGVVALVFVRLWLGLKSVEGARRELTSSEARFRALTEQSFDAVAVLGPDGVARYANSAVERILGYTPDEFMSINHLSLVHPDDLPTAVANVEEAVRIPGFLASFQYRLRHKDGSWRTIDSVGRNLIDEPAVGGFLVTLRDVTEQKLAEEAIRESEERFRAAFEGAPMGVAVGDLAGTLLHVNPALCELSGYAADELEGRSFTEFIPNDELELDLQALQLLVETGEPQRNLERRLLAKGGAERWLQVGISLLHDEAGAPNGIVLQAMDVTARKMAEADRAHAHTLLRRQNALLRDADRLRGELISVVSHDLRTPLTSIMGYLELVLDEAEGPLTQEQRRFLEVIERNSDRLLALVNDLLLISSAEAGRLELRLAEADLFEVAAHVVESQRPRAEGLGLELRLTGEAVLAVVDRARIAELLENLVSNALKFTPAGGSVEVRVSRLDELAVLEVADTGVGISAGDRNHMFERFFRSRRARKVPGIGLGLSIVEAIVTAHGGRISVESLPNEGTTFRVELARESTSAARRPLGAGGVSAR
jgi:PAS domain S-box-containing protein